MQNAYRPALTGTGKKCLRFCFHWGNMPYFKALGLLAYCPNESKILNTSFQYQLGLGDMGKHLYLYFLANFRYTVNIYIYIYIYIYIQALVI